VGTRRTAWHPPFAALIAERAPRGFLVKAEEHLTEEPLRADMILRRVAKVVAKPARVLRRLWAWLGAETVAEFKSLARPFRRGDLLRLWGYGVQYHVRHAKRLRPGQLTLLLIVPRLTRALRAEIAWMGLAFHDLGGGYGRVDGALYCVYIVIIDEVAEAERDAFLSLFGPRPLDDEQARWWLSQFVTQGKVQMEKLEGYDRMARRLWDIIPAKQRQRLLTAKQRLDGLTPEQILRGLPDEYVRTFPPEMQEEIRRRARKRRSSAAARAARTRKKAR